MTSPLIRPGPFSFLASAGDAAGKIGQALIDKRQRDEEQRTAHQSEARQAVAIIQAMVDRGDILAEDFDKHPDIIKTYETAGFPLPTRTSVAGRKAGIQHQALAGEFVTPENRAIAGLPSEESLVTGRVGANVAQRKLDALEGGTAAQQEVVSGVPSPTTAEIGLSGALRPELVKLAQRYIDAASIQFGRIPKDAPGRKQLVDTAYKFYTDESTSQGIAPRPRSVFQSYFDAALASSVEQQTRLDISAAQAANSGQRADTTPALLNAINANISTMRTQAADLRKALTDPVSVFSYQRANEYSTPDDARRALNAQIQALENAAGVQQQHYNSVLGGTPTPGIVGAGGPETGVSADQLAAELPAWVEAFAQGLVTIEELNTWVSRGSMTPAYRRAIIQAAEAQQRPFTSDSTPGAAAPRPAPDSGVPVPRQLRRQ